MSAVLTFHPPLCRPIWSALPGKGPTFAKRFSLKLSSAVSLILSATVFSLLFTAFQMYAETPTVEIVLQFSGNSHVTPKKIGRILERQNVGFQMRHVDKQHLELHHMFQHEEIGLNAKAHSTLEPYAYKPPIDLEASLPPRSTL